ncbi:M1 family metallopeptidase [Taibaiella koreensis]|uniref:M1 family metallopeptidase n=1 Tax=Taibaiella koreensis TaxID=1268548 RepID=UPI0013C32A0D|nr:M1 family metallopeptidase [Taibaiella koreensis]
MNLKRIGTALLLSLSCIVSAQQPYWQQRVDNHIAVTLDDKEHMLHGHISMRYANNSPDTLRYIYMHLFPNAYSSDRTAFERQAVENRNTKHYFSAEKDRGYIDSLKFSVFSGEMGRLAGVVTTADPDVIRLVLPEPLAPGGQVTIETPFRVKLPLTFSRMGHEGQSYQVSQWFPKPAVYDARGWHQMPYLDQGEFYSEYGAYHVEVTLPENYVIMGTGNILEATERAWLDSLSRMPARYTEKESRKSALLRDTVNIPSSTAMKTVTFEEENIHDFAWFADKRWLVRKDTIAVPGTGNSVTAYACYLPRHEAGWSKSMQWIRDAIGGYSTAVGPYPYKTVKAVEGALSAGGGMEYPTITVIAASNNEEEVHTAVVHEVGHNWFYGMLGSNERAYPWMDEGINSFYEHKFAPSVSSLKRLMGGKDENQVVYSMLSATHDLVPADTAAAVMPEMNYLADIYVKSAGLLGWLEAYMGPDTFRTAMQEYFTAWQYKHPQPADFEQIFRRNTTQNLDWFFNEAMHSSRPVDFALKAGKEGVTLKNKTGLNAPAAFVAYQGQDSTVQWVAPFTGTKHIPYATPGTYSRVKIADAIPDYNYRNNEDRSPLALRPFLGFNTTPQNKIWYAPAIGYNYYDGFMAGLLLHNITVPQHKFQFILAPLYGFSSGTFAGTGIIGYTAYFDKGWLHDIQLNLEGKTFSYDKTNTNIPDFLHSRYVKVAPEIIFNLRKPEWRSTVTRSISLKGYWIREEQFAFNMNPSDSLYYPSKGGYEDNFYARLRYRHENQRTFNPFSYQLEGQVGKSFAKLSLEANLKIDYFKKNKALYIRGYAGKFWDLTSSGTDAYRYRIANTYSGWNDYLYDETYGGRSEATGTWSQQVSMKEGGFKVNTLQYALQLGLSDDWLVSLNIKSDLPFFNLPIRLFADVSTFSNARQMNPSGATVLYVAGIEISGGDLFSIYIPLVMSRDFTDYTKSVYPENRFLKTITFSLNLGNVDWMKLPGKILKM